MKAPKRPLLELPEVEALSVPPGLVESAAALGVELSAAQWQEQGHFLATLLAMNERMNLTAIRAREAAWEKHCLDALSVLPFVAALPSGAWVADVGSGGGVPAVPLALARRDVHWAFIEATQKKAAFLSQYCLRRGLQHVTVYPRRAEELIVKGHKGKYQLVTARAVGRLAELLAWTVPLLAVGGQAVLIKGQRAEEELAEAQKELHQLGASFCKTVETPTGRLVVVERKA